MSFLMLESLFCGDPLAEACLLLESTEVATTVKASLSKLPEFPGIKLRAEINRLLKDSAKLIYNYAKEAKPWVKQRGYRTEVFDKMLQSPEAVAKKLVARYMEEYQNDPSKFATKEDMKIKIAELLKDISLILPGEEGYVDHS